MTRAELLNLVRRTHYNHCTEARCDVCYAVQQGLGLLAVALLRQRRTLLRDIEKGYQLLRNVAELEAEERRFQTNSEQAHLRLSNYLKQVHGGFCAKAACPICTLLQQGSSLLAARTMVEMRQTTPALLSFYGAAYTDERFQAEMAAVPTDPRQRLGAMVYNYHFCEDNHCPVCASLKLNLPIAAARQLSTRLEPPREIVELLDLIYTQAEYLRELRVLRDAPRTECPQCASTIWTPPGRVCCDGCLYEFIWEAPQEEEAVYG